MTATGDHALPNSSPGAPVREAAPELALRLATLDDLPALHTLIDTSVRTLSTSFLSPQQIEAELRFVISPDTQLIRDGTYFVVEAGDGTLAGAGGWSQRRALHGGDQFKALAADADAPLVPGLDPARIRAMFVHPRWARRGIGRRIFEAARAAAAAAGFDRLILTATLPGEPLYAALGFRAERRYEDVLPDGSTVPVVEMTRPIDLHGAT